eukprot:GFYU01011562.1.p1 GENE.GFYU01011562.1~~GFYU01011562.1.p1  ORF type:complete len:736 (+),score=264.88 GFYU01011562.1:147-2210(+)
MEAKLNAAVAEKDGLSEEKSQLEQQMAAMKVDVDQMADKLQEAGLERPPVSTAWENVPTPASPKPAAAAPAAEPALTEDEKRQLIAALEKQKAKIEKLQRENGLLAEKLQKLSTTSKMLVKENEENEKKVADLTKENEELRANGGGQAAAPAPAAPAEKEVVTVVDTAAVDKLTAERDNLLQEIESMKGAMATSQTDSNDKISQLEASVAALQGDLGAAQSSNQQLQDANSDLAKQLEVANSRKLSEKLKEIARQTLDKSKQVPAVMNDLKATTQSSLQKVSDDFSTLGTKLVGAVKESARQEALARADRDELLTLYQKEVGLRKSIYNQLQDMRGTLRVYVRVRPVLSSDPPETGNDGYLAFPGDGQITVRDKNDALKRFDYDSVFAQAATQEQIFSDTLPLITSVADGFNVCIFAYGQTGTGKTFTMNGPRDNPGINTRALETLFEVLKTRTETEKFEVKISLLEIYNDQIRDLLTTDWDGKRYDVYKDDYLGMTCPDLVEVVVANTDDVLEWIAKGQTNRSVGTTNMNEHSSRSHMMLRVLCQCENLTTGEKSLGKLALVDLAGSERLSKSEATGSTLKETQHINKSLAALGDVIAGLANENPHIPYRNSKLTYLLQDSLGGNSKTLMFVNLSPLVRDCTETLCSLQFASRAKTVFLGQAKKNVSKGSKSSPAASPKPSKAGRK